MEPKTTPEQGQEQMAGKENQLFCFFLKGTERAARRATHTRPATQQQNQPSVGEKAPCSTTLSLPPWATTAFPAQGKQLVDILASDPGTVELYWHINSEKHGSPCTGQCVWGVSADCCPCHSQLCFINLFALFCVWGLLLVHNQSLPSFEKWGLEPADLHPAL